MRTSEQVFTWCLLASLAGHGLVSGILFTVGVPSRSSPTLVTTQNSTQALEVFLASASDLPIVVQQSEQPMPTPPVSSVEDRVPSVPDSRPIETAAPIERPTVVPTRVVPRRIIATPIPSSPRQTSEPRPKLTGAVPSSISSSKIEGGETPDPAPTAASPALGGTDQPIRVVTGVEYASNPPPKYPDTARRRRLSGTVIIDVVVDSSGHVVDLRLERSSGHTMLDDAAQSAVLGWHFTPATVNGKTLMSKVRVPVTFQIR
jgi:protein TonB